MLVYVLMLLFLMTIIYHLYYYISIIIDIHVCFVLFFQWMNVGSHDLLFLSFSPHQAFVSTGTNLQLIFNPCANSYSGTDYCDFDKEKGKVSSRKLIFYILSLICAVVHKQWLGCVRWASRCDDDDAWCNVNIAYNMLTQIWN